MLLALGTVFGPLIVALGLAVIFADLEPNPLNPRSEAERLLAMFRDEEKNRIVMYRTSMPPDGAECGYDPSELFPEDFTESLMEKRFSPHSGYMLLHQWRRDTKWAEFNADLAEALEAKRSSIEIGFLRRCVSWTLARSVCMEHIDGLVRSVGKDVGFHNDQTRKSPFFGYGTENSVVCLYADGVAARQGLSLSENEP